MNREKIKGNSFGGPTPPFTPTQSPTPPLPPHTNIPRFEIDNNNVYIKLTINYVIERKKNRVRERKKNRERERLER